MAKIVLSADAPDGLKTVSLGNAVVDVPSESTDPAVISGAASHPFLQVEFEPVKLPDEKPKARVIDPLSAESDEAKSAFDPDAIAAAEAAKVDQIAPVAIDAGKDQDKTGSRKQAIATTVAGADADASKTKTTAGDDS